MKVNTIYLAIALLNLNSTILKAQTQPNNGGFENWTNVGSFQDPTGWSSFNDLYQFSVPETSFKTTDAHSGVYALKLNSLTATIPPPLGTSVLDTIAGFVFIGGFDMNHPGTPYTDRPLTMEAYIKATIIPSSEAYIISTLSRWNTTTHSRDEIGTAMYYTPVSISNYTLTSTPFNYTSNLIPDTLDIKIMGGNVGPGGFIMPGCEFYVDDISFTFSLGLTDLTNKFDQISIYPNPSKENIRVTSENKLDRIEILSILGEKILIKDFLMNEKEIDLNVTFIENGVYLIRIFSNNRIFTKKITIN